jgi:hypothetical protein
MPSLAFQAKCDSDTMIIKDEARLIIALFAPFFNDLTIDKVTFIFGNSGINI